MFKELCGYMKVPSLEGLLPSSTCCIARHFLEQELFYLPPHNEEFNFWNFSSSSL